MTASQPIVDKILKQKELGPEKMVAIITRDKKKAAKVRAMTKPKIKETVLYDECETTLQQMLNKVKHLGRVPKDEFYGKLGGVARQAWFRRLVEEIHYIHIQEDDDGTCELFIDETERDLCTAVHKALATLKEASGKGTKFHFNQPLFVKLIRDLYDLSRKASMHEQLR